MIVNAKGVRALLSGSVLLRKSGKHHLLLKWLNRSTTDFSSSELAEDPRKNPILPLEEGKRPEPVENRAVRPDFLAYGPHALPLELRNRTAVLPFREKVWWEQALCSIHFCGLAAKMRELRKAWALFRASSKYSVIITTGTLDGLAFAFLQRLRGSRRPIQLMYDCYWYGGNWLRRAWMRACLRQVDRCAVWARIEAIRYARAYDVPREKFAFVRHHHSLLHYSYTVGDKGHIFAGGNSDRDYGPFLAAVRDLPVNCILATTRPQLLEGRELPSNVQVVRATPSEFRQLIADSRIVVVAMQANLLRTGGQQTFLNAMYMGKPVILTDPEGGTDYIENGRTGFLVPYGDADALRRVITFLLDHPEEARGIGERSREVAAPLTTERCNNEIWNLGIELLKQRRAQNREAAGGSKQESSNI